MPKILVVFTGGTIGSTLRNGTINTSLQQGYQLIDLFKASAANSPHLVFNTVQPLHLLSENLFPVVWKTLIHAIEAEDISQYDGIIVTHGTDTLAYTAAALGLYFNAIQLPLLLVSSDYPLAHPLANGLDNFMCAVEYIKQGKAPGVFVPYKNAHADMHLHLACRLSSCLPLTGDFISVQSIPYLSFINSCFYQKDDVISVGQQSISLVADFSPRILLIKPYPGLDYSCFSLENVDVVLHDLHHSGTACSTVEWGEQYSLLSLIKRCHTKHIPFFMAPAIKNDNVYDSMGVVFELGAKILWNMSLEVAYIKLLLAFSNFDDEDKRLDFLANNMAYEQVGTPTVFR